MPNSNQSKKSFSKNSSCCATYAATRNRTDPRGYPVPRLDRRAAQRYFGEGVVDWGPYVFEWTWKSHICFVYDRFSLQPVKRLTYTGEGWGMTHTATEIITSDGTATLRFRNPKTFEQTRQILVKDNRQNSTC